MNSKKSMNRTKEHGESLPKTNLKIIGIYHENYQPPLDTSHYTPSLLQTKKTKPAKQLDHILLDSWLVAELD